MTLLLENESETKLSIDYEQIASRVIEASLQYVGCPYSCEVNLLLTDDDGIREMNHRMRGLDVPTDVLSFPALTFEVEGDFSIAEANPASNFDVSTGELLLGDILISLERVRRQAEEYGHSVTREYAFLIAHSMLHLSGYDHMTESDRVRMERMQDEILNTVGYTRELTDKGE